jgi:hypothetical protein
VESGNHRKAWRRQESADIKTDNVSLDPQHGNRRDYTLTRLKRARPDLFARVTRQELSANAAAIEAGFRKKPSPLEQIQKLLPKLTPQERVIVWRTLWGPDIFTPKPPMR